MHPPTDACENDQTTIAPSTPPRQHITTARTNAPNRQSQRDRAPSRKLRENVELEKDVDDESSRGARRGQASETPVATEDAPNSPLMMAFTAAFTTAMHAMETRIMAAIDAKMAEMMAQTEAKINGTTEHNENCVARLDQLESQMDAMMDLLRKTASEQAKATQSWANVAAKAAIPPTNVTPSPPASSPSLNSSSLNPRSSISRGSDAPQPIVVLDLSGTSDRSNDVVQLKAMANEALGKHEATKAVRCTGVQKRGGGEHRIKCIFESEEHARIARAHPAWLQTPRFVGARMLGEEWYPVKVDRVGKSTVCDGDSTTISDSARQRLAEENGVEIHRIRWLSRTSSKEYGSVVVFMVNREEADQLLKNGRMDFGGEMAYVGRYERRKYPIRCFRCHQYGHQEVRCTSATSVCGNCAETGHTAPDCSGNRVRCAACKGRHPATDRACPTYLEQLQRMNPAKSHE